MPLWGRRSTKEDGERKTAPFQRDGSGPAEADELFAAADFDVLPAGAEEVLLLGRDGEALLASRTDCEFLLSCSDFGTLRDQAAEAVRRLEMGVGDADFVADRLRELARRGFLVSWPGAREAQEPAEAASSVASVGLRCADRPSTARRCLEGFLKNARDFGHDPDWRIFDNSAEGAASAEYRDLAVALARETQARIRYIGPGERMAFAKALAAKGIPEASAGFCLLGVPGLGADYGLDLNAQLLDLVGEMGLGLDEDVVCNFGPLPGSLPGVVMGAGDPTEFHFFPDRDSARAAIASQDADWLGLHEAYLGRSTRAIIAREGVPLLHADGNNRRLALSALRPESRVAVTHPGIGGDSAMGSSRYLLELEGDSRERLHAEEGLFEASLEERAMLRAPRRCTIGRGGLSMGYALGMDARTLLPPFFPHFRNSDGVFGLTLSLIDPAAHYAYLPWTVEHDPPNSRRQDRGILIEASAAYGLLDALLDLEQQLSRSLFAAATVEARMRLLGRLCAEAGSLDEADFLGMLRPLYYRRKAAQLGILRERLATYGPEPPAWAELTEACAIAIERSLEAPFQIAELSGRAPQVPELRLASSLVRGYGELLQCWPDMMAAARELKAEGRGLGASA